MECKYTKEKTPKHANKNKYYHNDKKIMILKPNQYLLKKVIKKA